MAKFSALIFFLIILQPLNAQTNFDNMTDTKEYKRGYADGTDRTSKVSQLDLRIYGCCGGMSAASLAGGLMTYFLVKSENFDADAHEDCLFAVPVATIGAGIAAGSIISLIAVKQGDISGDLMGKSDAYTRGYMDAYKEATKKHKKIITKSAGLGTSIACVGVANFLLVVLTIHNLSF